MGFYTNVRIASIKTTRSLKAGFVSCKKRKEIKRFGSPFTFFNLALDKRLHSVAFICDV